MKLNKRLMSGVMALLMAATPMIPYNVFNNNMIVSEAVEIYTDSDGTQWLYTIIDANTCCINSATISSSVKILNIPNTIKGMKVTKISGSGLASKIKSSSVTKVVIPNNITYLSSEVFKGCIKLTSVTLSANLTSIPSYAFAGCRGLTSITIPSSVKGIGEYAFQDCSGLTSVIFEGTNVTTIKDYAFQGCFRLKSITIPNGVESIGVSTFNGCALTRINIPSSVKSIGSYAFASCSSLIDVTFSEGIENIGNYAFRGTLLSTVTIPNSIKAITDAFSGCKSLKTINVNNSHSSLVSQDGVLYKKSMAALLKVPEGKTGSFVLPSTITTISPNSIASNSLSSITVEKENTKFKIDDGLLTDSTKTTLYGVAQRSDFSGKMVVIPSSVNEIPTNIFNNCSSLEKIKILNKDTIINENSFKNCSDSLIIYGYKNSTAYTYANENGHSYGGIISDEDLGVSLSETEFTYDGTEKKPSVVIDDPTFTESDCDVTYIDNVNAGTGRVLIKGINNLTGSLTKTFSINAIEITDVILSDVFYFYDGTEKKPSVIVKYENNVLSEDDYTIEYSNNINIGTGTVTVTGKGNYCGTITKNFEITNQNDNISVVAPEPKTYGDNDFELFINNPNNVLLDFQSNNENVVTVNENGVVSITGAGETIILISASENNTINYYIDPIEIPIVINKKKASLSLSVEKNEIAYNGSTTVLADYEGESELLYQSSDNNIATVDENGVITATGNNIGDVRITVTAPESSNYKSTETYIDLKITGNMSFIKQPENLNIRLNNDATFTVETEGIVKNYQWYVSTTGLTNGNAIMNADEKIYTIPANQLNYDMNGIYVYCIASNGYDKDIISNVVKLNIEEKPTTPMFSLSIQNESWINQEVQISLFGSKINNASNDVAYKYSFNGGIDWINYEDAIIWNTDTKESTILVKAYNVLYPEIESDINAFVLKFDATSPIINEVNINDSNVTVMATDEISGVATYGISPVNSSNEVMTWSNNNSFNITEEGQYYAFAKDNAGNISESRIFNIEEKEEPTEKPTETPTEKPTERPTEKPTEVPTKKDCSHKYTDWKITKKASCTSTGEMQRTCKSCSDVEKQTIAKTSHSHTKTTVKATTKADGYVADKCSICGNTNNKTVINKIKTVSLSKNKYTYNGKSIKPTVKVVDSEGKAISTTNYTVSYKNNKNIGKATVSITFKGNYSGKKTKTFVINPKNIKVTKVTPNKSKLIVSWKKDNVITGYEIKYSTSSKLTSKTTKTICVSNKKIQKTTISKLKNKTKYYIKIRSYKKVNGKKYYSSWSSIKSAKTK